MDHYINSKKLRYKRYLIYVCFFAVIAKIHATELPFVIVISSYNNAKWVKKNLDSVFSQNYRNFRVIYIDDASQDGTTDIVEAYIQEHALQDKVTLIKNTHRSMKLRNIYNVYYLCQDHELIAQLDGDDWLAHANVLNLMNDIFSNQDVWFSYGQFMHSNGKIGFCRDVSFQEKQNALFRQLPFVMSHLKVFYAWLFKMVKLQDLLVESICGWEGLYYPYANDCATVYPMLEMARERVIFNSEVVYIFNRDNPISGHISQAALQSACNREIKTLPVYQKLSKPVIKRLEPFKKATVECLILSDNPSSLRATLQSITKCMSEVAKIIVWYQPSQDTTNEYQELKKQFGNVDFYNITLAENLIGSLEINSCKYLICLCDKIVLHAPLNYKKWIMELERTFAYACYGLLTCTDFEEYGISYQYIQDDLYAWKFLCDKPKSINPHNFGLTLYRKADFISAYRNKKVQTLEDIVQLWTLKMIDSRKVGIFFDATSKTNTTKLGKNMKRFRNYFL